MKKLLYLFFFISFFGYSQTQITNDNFQEAINTCLTTNPVDGLCSDSEYGAMPDWDVSNVTNMGAMFEYASSFNADISNWDVSSVTNMSNMFANASSFNRDLSNWDISSVTDMKVMFAYASSFNQSLNDWETSNVTNMYAMFAYASSFNGDISNWDVSSVNNMSNMFSYASSFNGDVSNWDVSRITNMSTMFTNASSFNQPLNDWDVSSVTDMYAMFANASSFNRDLSNWDVSSVTEMRVMLGNSALSTENYDALLNGWSQQNIQSNVTLGAQFLSYCNGEDARQSLIDNHNWIISDDGLDCSTAGVDDQKQLDISIYPNPTNDKLFIQGLSSSSKVSIYNVLGKLVLSQTISKEIDVNNLQSGIYIIKITDEQKEIVRKFIKD
jgi:surface protein